MSDVEDWEQWEDNTNIQVPADTFKQEDDLETAEQQKQLKKQEEEELKKQLQIEERERKRKEKEEQDVKNTTLAQQKHANFYDPFDLPDNSQLKTDLIEKNKKHQINELFGSKEEMDLIKNLKLSNGEAYAAWGAQTGDLLAESFDLSEVELKEFFFTLFNLSDPLLSAKCYRTVIANLKEICNEKTGEETQTKSTKGPNVRIDDRKFDEDDLDDDDEEEIEPAIE